MHELSLYHIRTQVTVKQHDGKEDEQGERTAASDTRHDSRRYSVTAGQLIRVTLKNWSKTPLKMIPVWLVSRPACLARGFHNSGNRTRLSVLASVISYHHRIRSSMNLNLLELLTHAKIHMSKLVDMSISKTPSSSLETSPSGRSFRFIKAYRYRSLGG